MAIVTRAVKYKWTSHMNEPQSFYGENMFSSQSVYTLLCTVPFISYSHGKCLNFEEAMSLESTGRLGQIVSTILKFNTVHYNVSVQVSLQFWSQLYCLWYCIKSREKDSNTCCQNRIKVCWIMLMMSHDVIIFACNIAIITKFCGRYMYL